MYTFCYRDRKKYEELKYEGRILEDYEREILSEEAMKQKVKIEREK